MTIDLQTNTSESNPPRTPTESLIANLWQEVLQTPELPGPSDDFFAAGGNSMSMVMLEYRIQEELSIELPAGVLLGAPTLQELAALVDAECEASRACDDAQSAS